MKKVYLIAVVVAIIAGFATYLFISDINQRTTIKDAETVQVIVPVADMAKNTEITEDMFAEDAGIFQTKTVIATDAAPNVVTKNEDLIGKITIDTLYANEQINSQRLQAKDGEDVALSFHLPKGKVAYSISAANVVSVDGYISEGDTVDVLISVPQEDDTVKTEVAYKGLYILRVSDNSTNTSASTSGEKITSYSTLTLEVTEKQALDLLKLENTYSYKLVLNPRKPATKK